MASGMEAAPGSPFPLPEGRTGTQGHAGLSLPTLLQGLPGRNGASGQQGFPGPRVSPGESWGALDPTFLGRTPSTFTRAQGGAHVVHQPGGSPQERGASPGEPSSPPHCGSVVQGLGGQCDREGGPHCTQLGSDCFMKMARPWGRWFADFHTHTHRKFVFFFMESGALICLIHKK